MKEAIKDRGVALITGGSAGIGRALAKLLAKEGFELVILGRDLARLEEAKRECEAAGAPSVHCHSVNLSDWAEVDRLLTLESARIDRVSLLVNNAAFGVHAEFLETDTRAEYDMVEMQCAVTLRLIRACLPGMVERRHGGIINVSSLYACMPVPFQAAYAASKSFLLSLSQSLHYELREKGVVVSAVCPGLTDTMFRRGMSARAWHGMTAADVAKAAWRGHLRQKPVIVPGAINKAIWAVCRVVPARLLVRALVAINSRRGLARALRA